MYVNYSVSIDFKSVPKKNQNIPDKPGIFIIRDVPHADRVLLVIDERAGRSVAKEKGLKVIGTAAIIGIAKQQGLIGSAREVFECLHQSSFRIAPAVIKQVLNRVGE